MGFLEVIAGEEDAPENSKGINPHNICALYGAFRRSRQRPDLGDTPRDVLNGFLDRMNLANGPFRAQLREWVVDIGRLDPDGKNMNRQKVHDSLMNLEAELITVAEAKLELDVPDE